MGQWVKISPLISVLLFGCEDSVVSYCEAVTSNGETIALSIPQDYYAFPRYPDNMITLKLRYRDLSAPENLTKATIRGNWIILTGALIEAIRPLYSRYIAAAICSGRVQYLIWKSATRLERWLSPTGKAG